MTQKERKAEKKRLIKLLLSSQLRDMPEEATAKEIQERADYLRPWAIWCADYLLSNGLIAPPCKVGDTVYMIDYDCEYQYCVDCDASCGSCKHRNDEIRKCLVRSNHQVITIMESWKTDYFPTREAAEQALKEREENAN